MKIATDKDFSSLGRLSEIYQVSPRMIEKSLDSIGAEPSLSLDGIVYFAITDEQDAQLRSLFAELAENRRANAARNKGSEWTASLPIPEGYKPVDFTKDR